MPRLIPFVGPPSSRRRPEAKDRARLAALIDNLQIIALERPFVLGVLATLAERLVEKIREDGARR